MNMKITSLSFLFVFIIFFGQNAFSQTGCYVASQNRIYTNTGDPNNCLYYFTFCPNDSPSKSVAAVDPTGTTTCTYCNNQPSGVLRNYTVQQCPIDDYLWLLLFPLSLVGFQLIKRKVQVFENP